MNYLILGKSNDNIHIYWSSMLSKRTFDNGPKAGKTLKKNHTNIKHVKSTYDTVA